eukprot:TRINITY_DN1770_c0_g1_i1.p1 TRINITY_DN1770_c0_g1~~TRINITY_DN1770_c0_g1_i1.p1  ORF type:complete len:254 (+),score=99.47 TRINITY_DN1770_c0_g1_i1:186-947(+)
MQNPKTSNKHCVACEAVYGEDLHVITPGKVPVVEQPVVEKKQDVSKFEDADGEEAEHDVKGPSTLLAHQKRLRVEVEQGITNKFEAKNASTKVVSNVDGVEKSPGQANHDGKKRKVQKNRGKVKAVPTVVDMRSSASVDDFQSQQQQQQQQGGQQMQQQTQQPRYDNNGALGGQYSIEYDDEDQYEEYMVEIESRSVLTNTANSLLLKMDATRRALDAADMVDEVTALANLIKTLAVTLESVGRVRSESRFED